jgi:hypothetical protein
MMLSSACGQETVGEQALGTKLPNALLLFLERSMALRKAIQINWNTCPIFGGMRFAA